MISTETVSYLLAFLQDIIITVTQRHFVCFPCEVCVRLTHCFFRQVIGQTLLALKLCITDLKPSIHFCKQVKQTHHDTDDPGKNVYCHTGPAFWSPLPFNRFININVMKYKLARWICRKSMLVISGPNKSFEHKTTQNTPLSAIREHVIPECTATHSVNVYVYSR